MKNKKILNYIMLFLMLIMPLSIYYVNNFHSISNLSFIISILFMTLSYLAIPLAIMNNYEKALNKKEMLSLIVVNIILVLLIFLLKVSFFVALPYISLLLVLLLSKYFNKFLSKYLYLTIIITIILNIINMTFALNIIIFPLILFYILGYFLQNKVWHLSKIFLFSIFIITLLFITINTYDLTILNNCFTQKYLNFYNLYFFIYTFSGYFLFKEISLNNIIVMVNEKFLFLIIFLYNIITLCILKLTNFVLKFNFLISIVVFVMIGFLIIYLICYMSKKIHFLQKYNIIEAKENEGEKNGNKSKN